MWHLNFSVIFLQEHDYDSGKAISQRDIKISWVLQGLVYKGLITLQNFLETHTDKHDHL